MLAFNDDDGVCDACDDDVCDACDDDAYACDVCPCDACLCGPYLCDGLRLQMPHCLLRVRLQVVQG